MENIKVVPYESINRKKNRLYTLGFYNLDVSNDYKAKFLVKCKLLTRTLNKSCKLYIRGDHT